MLLWNVDGWHMHEWARGGRNGLRGAAGGSYRYTKYLGQLGIDFEGNFYVFLKIFVRLSVFFAFFKSTSRSSIT